MANKFKKISRLYEEKSSEFIYSLLLFLFIFTMINREFRILNLIDIRYLILIMITVDFVFKFNTYINKLKLELKKTLFKVISLFYLLILISNIYNLYFNKGFNDISLNLRIFFLVIYGGICIIYFILNKYRFSYKMMTFYLTISTGILILSMIVSFININSGSYLPMSNITGSLVHENSANLLRLPFRLAGYAEDPNYASFALIITCGALFYYVKDKRKYYLISFFMITYLFSASKTILIGLIMFTFLSFLQKRQTNIRNKIYFKIFLKYSLYILLFSSIFIAIIFLSFASNIDPSKFVGNSLGQRIQMWQQSYSLFLIHPIFGSGLTSVRIYFEYHGLWRVQTHNTILQLLSESGLIVTILYFAFIGRVSLRTKNFSLLLIVLFITLNLTNETIYLSFFPYSIIILYISYDRNQPKREIEYYFVNSLKGGGAEQAVSNLLDIESKNTRVLITQKNTSKINEDIVYLNANIKSPIKLFLSLSWINNSVLYYGIDRVSFSIANLLKSHVVASLSILRKMTIYVFHSTAKSFNKGKFQLYLYKFLYNHRIIAVLSKKIGDNITSELKIKPKEVIYFKNTIPTTKIEKMVNESLIDQTRPFLLFVGRLEDVKDPMFLLELYNESKLFDKYDMIFLGEGKLKESMVDYIDKHNLSEYVKLKGFVDNPYTYYSKAYATILCSKYEAAPMIILESLYAGGKIVAYDCDFGPREMMVGVLSPYVIPDKNFSSWIKTIDSVKLYPDFNSYSFVFEGRGTEEILNEFRKVSI